MTIQELEKLDIVHVGSRMYPHKFFFPYVGEDILPFPYSIQDVYEIIYNKGFHEGKEYGKQLKIDEIKRTLGINTIEQ